MNFRTEVAGPPLNDASYPLKDTITHYFPAPAAKASFIIPATICGCIVVTVLVFLYVVVTKVGVNMSNMPDSFMGSVCTFMFFGMLFELFALLVVFWVKLNLLQMLPLLLISSNIIYSSFNFAFYSLKYLLSLLLPFTLVYTIQRLTLLHYIL